MTPRRAVATALLLVALFAGLTLWEMSGDSLVTDERWHLPVGYAYWKTREFRLSPDNPPLARLLAAAPLLTLDLNLPPTTPPEGRSFHGYPVPFGTAFFRLNPDVDRILFRSRLPIVGLGILLIGSLCLWSWRLHGDPRAGLLTLALAALEPTLLAHGHYVTTDMALAAFVVPAFAWLWAWSKSGRRRDLAFAAAAMGMALASKYPALVFLPAFVGLMLLRGPGARRDAAPARRLLLAGAALVLMGVIIQASYLFSAGPGIYLSGPADLMAYKPTDAQTWALGAFHAGNPWWYAPFAWLVKTPIPTMLLIAAGIAAAYGGRRSDPGRWRDLRDFVLLPAGLHAVAIAMLSASLGVRYLIPTTAFLLVAAGAAAAPLLATRGRRIAAVALGLWLVASVGRAAPEFIAYFNESIGARTNAPFVLHDSNLDWGQDLKRLARWQKEKAVPLLVLSYWGGAQPEYYGVHWRPMTGEEARADTPPPGVYAISVNRLIDMKKSAVLKGDDPRVDWLARFTPSERVGASIYIYRFGP
ncbi:MAG TPA: glycosyltransferase family 39 protein [Candidatus Polarisedimenticolia bacterium]|nr:glycosyltransferase family 39 protein [Candidatus Polarisedimenticolia bacterium]